MSISGTYRYFKNIYNKIISSEGLLKQTHRESKNILKSQSGGKLYIPQTEISKGKYLEKIEGRSYIELDEEKLLHRPGTRYTPDQLIAAAAARSLLEGGKRKKNPNISEISLGARIYGLLGKSNKALPKVKKFLDENKEEKFKFFEEEDYHFLKDYVERNSEDHQKQSRLEKSVGILGSILGFGGAILTLSLNLTGNAIGNIPTSSFNFLGFIFLGMGIASVALLMIKE